MMKSETNKNYTKRLRKKIKIKIIDHKLGLKDVIENK